MLDDLVAKLPEQSLRTADVDASQWFGEGAVFTYRELSVPEMFSVVRDADEIRKANPLWPEPLCRMVALLATSHVTPESRRPVGLVYCDILDRNGEAFLGLSVAFGKAFPGTEGVEEAVQAAKNASRTA